MRARTYALERVDGGRGRPRATGAWGWGQGRGIEGCVVDAAMDAAKLPAHETAKTYSSIAKN